MIPEHLGRMSLCAYRLMEALSNAREVRMYDGCGRIRTWTRTYVDLYGPRFVFFYVISPE